MIIVSVRGVSFHVVSVDEALDTLLQIRRFDGELELFIQFRDKQIVRQRFSHFHDPHDRGVDLVLTILER